MSDPHPGDSISVGDHYYILASTFTADLPKTRSGKIMRRLLRDIAEGKALGDTTTLADPNVVARLKEQYQEEH